MTLAPKQISLAETCAYLGCRGDPPPPLRRQAEEGIRAAAAIARPRAVWREFSLTELELPGRDIAAHLSGCRRAVLLAVTIGQEAESALRRLRRNRLSDAVVLDCALSAAAEAACEQLCAEIAAAYEARGERLTSRFSPGYGDFPLSFQGALLDCLDAGRRIGLTVSPDGLLLPRKSVTAVAGVLEGGRGPSRRPAASGCRDCSRYEACHIRKEGIPCGK